MKATLCRWNGWYWLNIETPSRHPFGGTEIINYRPYQIDISALNKEDLKDAEEWPVEIETEKIHADRAEGGFEEFPKFVDGKIKILRIL
jgi:hypothetical protein